MNEDRRYLTVSELNDYLKIYIQQNENLIDISVIGEVSGIKIIKGILYCTLKDDNAQIPLIIFNVASLSYIPEEGAKILVVGNPNFYVKNGRLSFIAQYVEPFGIGKLYLELEKLKKKLSNEGLFAEKHKKAIPSFPRNICVITSVQGAVIKDIVSTIRSKNDLINIDAFDVNVQGTNAVDSIVDAIKLVDALNYDIIILARGGGSFEDLLPFNSEKLAREIFNMKTPIISAIGHEVDFSISDFVADARASTPTAAAEMVSYNTVDIKNNIRDMLLKAESQINNKLINTQYSMVYMGKDLQYKIEKKLSEYHNLLNKYIEKIHILNPNNLLKKGYFKVLKNNVELSLAKDFNIGDCVDIIGYDGVISAEITQIKKR